MSIFESVSAPEINATAAAIGLLITLAAYALGREMQRRMLAAKYRDRLFDLNRLTVQSADVVAAFVDPANHTGAFFSSPPSGSLTAGLMAQVKAYVHFRLNFYEEVFYATHRFSMFPVFEDSHTWRDYIKDKLQHPLIREVLRAEERSFGRAFVLFAN